MPPESRRKKLVLPPGPLPIRYVRVELPGNGVWLSLAEVEVFSGQENVARKGKASQISTAFNGNAELAIDGNTNGHYFEAKSTTHTAKANNPWWEVDLGKVHAVDRIIVWNRTDGNTGERLKNFRIIALDENRQAVWLRHFTTPPKPNAKAILPKSSQDLDPQILAELAKYRAGSTSDHPDRKRLQELKKELASIKGVTTPIMRELPPDRRRKTHIQIRGNFLEKGKEVQPGFPAVFSRHNVEPTAEINRLTLADWLMDERNPLTARVAVNRYWEQLFGLGLVETSEDFGVQGEPPSHPLLLDYLAVEFMKQNWDTKRLLRLIVSSATYRQSSRVFARTGQA
ncbi:MAG: hypothetical protein KatS3mg105_3332 [Gemmatales bacterium]|nr:MAG: hypothetical protein KatS3mg105_3332 [Gemmatales bacterium]